MKLGIASMALVASWIGGSDLARADRAFRCPTGRLVTLGDHTYEVRSKCGVPSQTERRVETRTDGRARRSDSASAVDFRERTVEIVVDEWVYDLGPGRLLRLLCFRDGYLVEIRSRGRPR